MPAAQGGAHSDGGLDFRALRSARGRRRRGTVVRAGARGGASIARGTVLPAGKVVLNASYQFFVEECKGAVTPRRAAPPSTLELV